MDIVTYSNWMQLFLFLIQLIIYSTAITSIFLKYVKTDINKFEYKQENTTKGSLDPLDNN